MDPGARNVAVSGRVLARWDGTTTVVEQVSLPASSPSLRLRPAGYSCLTYSHSDDDSVLYEYVLVGMSKAVLRRRATAGGRLLAA